MKVSFLIFGEKIIETSHSRNKKHSVESDLQCHLRWRRANSSISWHNCLPKLSFVLNHVSPFETGLFVVICRKIPLGKNCRMTNSNSTWRCQRWKKRFYPSIVPNPTGNPLKPGFNLSIKNLGINERISPAYTSHCHEDFSFLVLRTSSQTQMLGNQVTQL